MKLLLADDHALVRQGLRRILAEAFPKARFGETGSVAETLDRLTRESWNLLLLDIFMPDGGGLEVLKTITALPSIPPVLVVTSAPEDQLAARAFHCGASGYIEKRVAGTELLKAVRQLLAGGHYVSPELVERLAADRPGALPRPLHGELSNREFQVLQMILAGRQQKEIALALSLSPKTVSAFHRRLLHKLEVRNDVELVRYALEQGLAEGLPRTMPKSGAAAGDPPEPIT